MSLFLPIPESALMPARVAKLPGQRGVPRFVVGLTARSILAPEAACRPIGVRETRRAEKGTLRAAVRVVLTDTHSVSQSSLLAFCRDGWGEWEADQDGRST